MKDRHNYEDNVELLQALEMVLNKYEYLAWKDGTVPRHDSKIESAKMTFQKFGGYYEERWKLEA